MIAKLNKRANKPFNKKTVTYEEMIAIPEDYEDLVPVPVYINMEKKVIVNTMLKESDISNKALKHIFNDETNEAEELIFKMARE